MAGGTDDPGPGSRDRERFCSFRVTVALAAGVPARDTEAVNEGATAGAATRTCVATLGAVVAFAALEHGIGETLQGAGRADGLMFESWPRNDAFASVGGEPAMSIIPNLLVAGIVTCLLALVFVWVALRVGRGRHEGATLIGLSVLLLLAGGGMAPPLIGVVLGSVWARAQRVVPVARPSRFAASLGARWRPLLILTVAAYLMLVPGTVLLHLLFGVNSAGMVVVLIVMAFSGLVLTLVAARAADRAYAADHGRGEVVDSAPASVSW